MIDELSELIEMYEQGVWSRGDYFHRITLLVPKVSMDELLDVLPTSDRNDFVRWLRETYDNAVPAEQFVSIGHHDAPARTRERIDHLRAWLRANDGRYGPPPSRPVGHIEKSQKG